MNTELTLTVPIINDAVTEGSEVFFILAESSDNRILIMPDRANVTIIDEDGKHDDIYDVIHMTQSVF